ncbi:MAG TPA: hypothetical protein VI603_06995 [Saprospiraceae bacterium]|nr:hypothetical protein [Saprospiraceae bacterium]
MMRGYTLSILLCLTLTAISQQNIAVIYPNIAESKPVSIEIRDSIHNHLKSQKDLKHYTYTHQNKRLSFNPQMSSNAQENAARYLLLYHIDIREIYNPALTVYRSENAVTGVGFKLSPEAFINAKMIDLSTNEIVSVSVAHIENAIDFDTDVAISEKEGSFVISDYAKTFGSDPDVMKKVKPKEYAEALAKLHKSFLTKFKNFYRGKAPSVAQAIDNCELGYFLPGPMMIEEFVMDGDKAKKAKLTLAHDAIVQKYTSLRLYSLDTVGVYVVPELFGLYFVEDQNGKSLILDNSMFSKSKQVGESHLAGNKIYASFSSGGYSTKLGTKQEPLKIGINFGDLAITDLEEKLVAMSNIQLIDLGATYLVNQLREMYKQEQFIDDEFAAKAQGAQYLIVAKGDMIELVDVESGALLYAYPASEGYKGIADAAMELFDLEIEIVEVTKQKKNSVEKLRLFSPFGFNGDYFTLNIYELLSEKVGNEVKERPVELGICRAYNVDQAVVEFTVNKGETELFEAMQRGSKIRFRNKPFRFLGVTYK